MRRKSGIRLFPTQRSFVKASFARQSLHSSSLGPPDPQTNRPRRPKPWDFSLECEGEGGVGFFLTTKKCCPRLHFPTCLCCQKKLCRNFSCVHGKHRVQARNGKLHSITGQKKEILPSALRDCTANIPRSVKWGSPPSMHPSA